MKKLFIAAALIFATASASAALYTYDLVYDGTGFTFDGGISWDGQAFNVGDSLDITLSADTGDHWQFLQTFSDKWYANVYDTTGCTQTGSWTWSMTNDGANVLSSGGSSTQGCVHFGPWGDGGIDGVAGLIFDQYQFNYTFSSGNNTVLSTAFIGNDSLWGWSFDNGVEFQYVDANQRVDVPEPAPIALFALSIGLMGLMRKRSAK
ncbi:PEP-CTERM sorting domain-containing protein [Aestuariibacter halophilus]|uniref:PEP-CTERM sorting domain-containing protein n=1 Tax=Fluctibacter halophilus TaxID=226011 RepID=A0ABS8GAX6_9ALTE|nr:PEP-CTERM sorting domain-containing protein [Aestuariibacter halophilus]MCC2616381.1 PEP-CTERM sorting domain-containing protein [Aestuariibacter halophilus]